MHQPLLDPLKEISMRHLKRSNAKKIEFMNLKKNFTTKKKTTTRFKEKYLLLSQSCNKSRWRKTKRWRIYTKTG